MKTKALLGTLAIISLLSVRAGAQVSTAVTNGLSEPYNVVEDTNSNIYISDSANNRIVKVNENTQAASTLAGTGLPGTVDGPSYQAQFNNPQGLLAVNIGGTNGLLVTDSGNGLIRFVRFSDGNVATLAGNTNTPIGAVNAAGINASFNQPIGMDQDGAGNVYIADEFNKTIRVMNLNDPAFGVTNLVVTGTTFHHPTAVAFVAPNQLWVADSYNNSIKLITLATPTTGTLTTYMGSNTHSQITNFRDDPFGPSARFNLPSGLLWINGLGLLISDTGNNSIRLATNNPVFGATNFAVVTFAGTPGTAGSANGSDLSATFNSPEGLCPDPANGAFLVADLKTGSGLIRRIQTGLPPPPPAAPTILAVTTNFGQVSLTWTMVASATNYIVKRSPSSGGPYTPSTIIATTTGTNYTDTTVLNGTTYYYVVSAVNAGGESANSLEVSATVPIPPPPAPVIGWFDYEGNDQTGFFTVLHAVSGANYYTAHNDLLIAINPTINGLSTYYITTNGPQPVYSAPSSTNGSTPPFYQDGLGFAQSLPVTTIPDLVVSAVNVGPGGNSGIVTAEFRFQVANPTINGNNGAQFTVSDNTSNVVVWYTIDGTDPTNAPPSIGPVLITNSNPAMLSINVTTNILFKARAFRTGYSPSGVAAQSFSAANFVPNSISFGFASGEASSDFVASPGQTFYAPVTLSPLAGTVIYSLQFNLTVTNGGPNPGPALGGPPAPFTFQSMLMKPLPGVSPPVYIPILPEMFVNGGFTNLMFTNLVENLLGVGWVERSGETNLYNTRSQTLITYSMAHDDMFPNASQPNGVIVGGYSFQVPVNAGPNQTYQIQIGRPSATTDGIGTPGSSVFIYAPTNGSLAGGTINSIKNVTVGQRKYLAGNAYPFRWFNAGDFGNTNLQNADVEQVFQSAIYGLNYPPAGSDFFDAMDSCGGTYVDLGHGYLEFNNTISDPNALSALFDGNDTTINQIAFGDGQLDVCDVYVTYRRSLDTGSLLWFQRFWTNGVRVATANYAPVIQSSVARQSSGGKIKAAGISSNSAPFSITNMPSVNFTGGDTNTSAGQTVRIPITASIFGQYPLRVLGLKISVVPLDGSPALTMPISFSPVAALGAPYTSDSGSNNIYAAAWLDNTVAGLSNNATIGTLTVTIPAGATSSSAYAVHFDHASGSPNGIASFPKHVFTGLITLSSRTNSYYNDGIPDAWRLRWFGTIYNLLSTSNACPAGDGISNWKKYVAGVDPNTPNDFPSVNPNTPPPSGATMSIYWPTVSGKQYAILSSASLFPGNWTTNAVLTGTGANMEFDDHFAGTGKFYRVLILP